MMLKSVKITNPLWLGNIAPQINDFCKKVPIDGIVYESLYAYFASVVQYGGDKSELWVIFNDDKPCLFVQWMIRPLPFIGVAHGSFIYSWGKADGAMELAFKEFVSFSTKHRSPIMEMDIRNKSVLKVLNKYMDKFGYDVKETGLTNLIVRKKTKEA